jgi:hypothetical protein
MGSNLRGPLKRTIDEFLLAGLEQLTQRWVKNSPSHCGGGAQLNHLQTIDKTK